MTYGPYPWASPYSSVPTTSAPIASQSEATYLDYLKIKGFEDVGHFLVPYVVSGGYVTKNIKCNDMVDVSEIVAVIDNDVVHRNGASFRTKIPNTTYFLDFNKKGDFTWGTSHPDGTVNVDYLAVAEVITDAAANVSTIIDKAVPRGGFRLKSEYGLFGFMRPIFNVLDYGALGNGVIDDSISLQNAINAANLVGGSVFLPSGTYLIKNQLNVPDGVKEIFSYGNAMLKFYLNTDNQGIILNSTTNLNYSGIRHTQNPAHTSTLMILSQTNNTKIMNCTWETTGGMGIGLTMTTDTSIQNCYFTDTGRTALGAGHPSKPAIWVGEAPTFTNTRVKISYCRFISTNWSGVYFFPYTGSIDHCFFENCGESSVFTTYGAQNVSYTNNIISSAHAVHLAGFGLEIGDAQHVLIDSNIIYNCDEAGIGAGDLKDFIISNNTLHHNGKGTGANEHKAGIVLRQTRPDPQTTERGVISGNHCYDSYDPGQKVQLFGLSTYKQPGNGYIREITITGNNFMNNAISPVFIVNEETLGGNVIFANNLGYAQEPVTTLVTYPTSAGILNITSVGFRPRYVEIIGFLNNTRSKSYSAFSTDISNANIKYITENSTTIQQGAGACFFLIDDSGNTKTFATFNGNTNLGIQLTVQSYIGPLDVKMLITCYP